MIRSTHRILFILLIITTSPAIRLVSSYVFGLSILEQSLDVLNRLGQMKKKHLEPGFSYTDQMLENVTSQIGTLQDTADKNHKDLLEKLNQLPQELSLITDRKTLSYNYREMKEDWKTLVANLHSINVDGSIIPLKEDLPSMREMDSSWRETRKLVTTQGFFVKLTVNWQDTYGKLWEGPCYTYMSELQLRYSLFKEYIDFARNYFMSKYMLYTIYEYIDKKNYTGNKKKFSSDLQRYLNEDFDYFKKIMEETSREYWTCDPDEGMTSEKSFYELEALTTYYTIRENIDKPCDGNCSNVSIKTCKSEYDGGLCQKFRKCPMELTSCSYSYGMNLCINQQNETTYRRYAFIAAKYNGKECDQTISTLSYNTHVEMYDIRLSEQNSRNRLEYYNCMCHENNYYINTLPVKASRGHVIVGVELKLRDRVLYMDILEGKLQDDGTVDGEEFGPDVTENPEWSKANVMLDTDAEIDLSPTMVPENKNRVITGVQFVKTGNRIHLAVHSMAINIKTGLFVRKSLQIYKKDTLGEEEFELNDVDRPDRATKENTPVSSDNEYVKFQVSGLYEDGGQSTVPFVDNQQVLPYPRTPLSGISFYIRGQQGYGGFLGLKVYTFDVSQYIQKEISLVDGIKKIDEKLKLI